MTPCLLALMLAAVVVAGMLVGLALAGAFTTERRP